MGSKLKEALRALCSQYGWRYGVYWRVDGDSGNLRMEATYYEEQFGAVMEGILNLDQNVEERTLGELALSQKHLWIIPDDCSRKRASVVSNDSSRLLQVDNGCDIQCSTEIKTIAMIPAPPSSVLQFGSANKIMENSEFINQVKCMCQTPEILLELQTNRDNYSHGKTHDTKETSPSVISLGDPFFESDRCIEIAPVQQYLPTSMPCSTSIFSSHCHTSTMDALPTLFEKGDPFMGISTILFGNHQNAALDNNLLLSSSTRLQQDIMQTYSSHTVSHHSNELLNLMEQQLLKIMGTQQLSSLSQPNVPQENGILNTDCSRGSHWISTPTADSSQSSPVSPIVNRDRSSSKLLSQVPSFAQELLLDPECMFSEDLTHESAVSSFSKLNSTGFPTPSRQSLKQQSDILLMSVNNELIGSVAASNGFCHNDDFASTVLNGLTGEPTESLVADCHGRASDGKVYPNEPAPFLLDNDLFDDMDLDIKNCNQGDRCWDDILPEQSVNCSNLSTVVLDSIPGFYGNPVVRPEKEFFSNFGLEQLVDAVTGGSTNSKLSYDSAGIVNSVASHCSVNQYSIATNVGNNPSLGNQVVSLGLPCHSRSTPALLPEYNLAKIMWGSSNSANIKSQVNSWIDDCYSMNAASAITMQSKKTEEQVKVVKKRARPGESTRPRPKDRQLIQDRVKELRDLVPNGSKCSIDALLDRTIKHMLYLQSITKYADKLKQVDEPKMIGEQSGVVLRDNSSGGSGGATWAFEVAGQTMVCPIIVEDLSPPGQMLVEMLCEERGFFLEIADIIRGFGLTILKGAMESRDNKIWARFLVEATREVTRMEIFLSLVQLLQQTSSISPNGHSTKKNVANNVPTFDSFKQSPLPMAISLPDRLQ